MDRYLWSARRRGFTLARCKKIDGTTITITAIKQLCNVD
jgi:hypothetical protein